jgi:glucose/arabinose dehydrogenase
MRSWSAAFAGLIVSLAVMPAGAAVKTVPLGTFSRPTYIAVAPGAPSLLFVVEQPGKIQVLVNEKKRAAPFLDIADLVRAPPDAGAGGEQGLLSVAFAPNYAQSGLFYVYFVNSAGNDEVDEFKRSSNPLRAIRDSRRRLLVIGHQGATNHNGGQLQFGPSALLYISTGDGGALSPPGDPARNLNSLLGKILRIDPLHRTGTLPYRIPPNPFVGKPGRDEIFAYGLRNPWRFSFDGTQIAIGDVGQNRQEEVNFLAASAAKGANFGWPQYEGTLVFDAKRPGPGKPVFPMFTYSHDNGRCAIIGGFVVHDSSLTGLAGRYIYGDACTGEVRSFVARTSDQTARGDRASGLVLPGLSSFGLGFNGKVYVTQTSGAVARLARAP